MSERDTPLLLSDIRSSIIKILEYTAGMGFENYEADAKTKDAVERNFEIIGEAASRIPEDFKKLHDRIEWRIIKDFRNFIIHEYFGINNLIVWDIIQHRLPDLLTEVSAMIPSKNDR
ncbi:MAG: HepT-like ribonuclease domain-containing protein [Daejeonella sp.]